MIRERGLREVSLEREKRGREMWNFGDIGRSQMEMEMGAPPHNTAARSSQLSSAHLNNASFHSKNSS